MVVNTLVWLAERCGWRMKNELAVKELGAHPIYVTDQPLEDYQPPTQKDEGIHIDMQALENHMGDMMKPSFRVKNEEHSQWHKPENRKELQDLVCAMMAKDN